MYKIINIETWKRKNQYNFFKEYDNPYFNICTELDISACFDFTNQYSISFFIASLFASTKAVNLVEELKYRIRKEEVVLHEIVHAGSTIIKNDETFGFCYFNYLESYNQFNENAKKSLNDFKLKENNFNPQDNRDNLIHYSILPWISFSSISHARNWKTNNSVPIITMGKYTKKGGKLMMPVSIEVHHSLVDGLHVSKYFNHFQEILNNPKLYLNN
ncbi:MAG: chloramphenicol acetyltransferase [Candidatus Marinimicrobia bacterium]|nr:chloramphenicol acetyltransferase [Candidatus Neomarinimicrobiota bacterium]